MNTNICIIQLPACIQFGFVLNRVYIHRTVWPPLKTKRPLTSKFSINELPKAILSQLCFSSVYMILLKQRIPTNPATGLWWYLLFSGSFLQLITALREVLGLHPIVTSPPTWTTDIFSQDFWKNQVLQLKTEE